MVRSLTLLNVIESRRRGYFSNIRDSEPLSNLVPSNLLESIRCHETDVYPVTSVDDESAIPPLACSFSKVKTTCHILALVDENGTTALYNTNLAGEDSFITEWTAHSNAVFDVEWTATEQKLLTASGDQTICLWDASTKQKLLTCKGHTSSVRSVKYRPHDDAVFSSGSRDGHIRLWDTRCNIKGDGLSCVNVIKNAHCISLQEKKKKPRLGPAQSQDSQQSVTCVVFQNDNMLASSGAVDGCVKVWDIRKIKPENNTAVYNFTYSGPSKRTRGFSSLTFDSYFTKLFASCTDDVIYCYDFLGYKSEPVCTYQGHRNTSFYVKSVLSPDDQFLLSGSSDEHAYIWQVEKPNASPVILKGHRSEVSDVAWCKTDLFRIVTTSDDNTMRVWRLDASAEWRKKLGRSDQSCGVVGTAMKKEVVSVAEGQSVDAAAQSLQRSLCTTPKSSTSTVSALNRVSGSPVSVRPSSIKKWLNGRLGTTPGKASRNDDSHCVKETSEKGSDLSTHPCTPKTPISAESQEQQMELETNKLCGENHELVKQGAANNMETNKENQPKSDIKMFNNSPKDQKLGSNRDSSYEIIQGSCRKSCKRKLIDEHSPKSKKSRTDSYPDNKVVSDSITILKKEIETNEIETILEEKSCLKKGSILKDIEYDVNTSPEKCRQNSVNICERLNEAVCQSPTANLPNLVFDKPARLPQNIESTIEKEIKTVDWLTQMRIKKMAAYSPQSRKNKVKVVDGCEGLSKDSNGGVAALGKDKSPARGVKSITSFFFRVSQKP